MPETKDLGALLRELRERKEQLAVVLNEYGAVAGIVTVEDILEEIVGEIEDEFDLPDARITRIDEQTVVASGSLSIDDFNETVGTHLPQDGPGRWPGSCSRRSAAAPIRGTASRSTASRSASRRSTG